MEGEIFILDDIYFIYIEIIEIFKEFDWRPQQLFIEVFPK